MALAPPDVFLGQARATINGLLFDITEQVTSLNIFEVQRYFNFISSMYQKRLANVDDEAERGHLTLTSTLLIIPSDGLVEQMRLIFADEAKCCEIIACWVHKLRDLVGTMAAVPAIGLPLAGFSAYRGFISKSPMVPRAYGTRHVLKRTAPAGVSMMGRLNVIKWHSMDWMTSSIAARQQAVGCP